MAQSVAEHAIRLVLAHAGADPATCSLPRLDRQANIMVQRTPDNLYIILMAPKGRDSPLGATMGLVIGTVVELNLTEAWMLVQTEPNETPLKVWGPAGRLAQIVRGNEVWAQGRLCAEGVKASYVIVTAIGEGACTTKCS
jgi:hypothetical protein